jgi:CHRD domain-containing protein
MMKTSKRVGALASFAAAVAAIATGVAVGATSVNAVAYRLNATLTPSQVVPAVQAPTNAVGHFHGVLIRSGIGATRVASLAGCKLVQPPRRSGLPFKLNCSGAIVTLPGTPGQWRLFWKLSVSGLSGPATAAAIHIAPVGHSAAAMAAMCAPCASISHGALALTANQANSLLNNSAYVDVSTARNPGGEIRGQIVRTTVGFQIGR